MSASFRFGKLTYCLITLAESNPTRRVYHRRQSLNYSRRPRTV